MNDKAQGYWNKIIELYAGLGLLSRLDGGILAILSNALALLEDAQRDIEARGMLLVDEKRRERVNPSLRVIERARVDAIRALAEIGGTPSSRSRLKAADGQPLNALERFLEKHA